MEFTHEKFKKIALYLGENLSPALRQSLSDLQGGGSAVPLEQKVKVALTALHTEAQQRDIFYKDIQLCDQEFKHRKILLFPLFHPDKWMDFKNDQEVNVLCRALWDMLKTSTDRYLHKSQRTDYNFHLAEGKQLIEIALSIDQFSHMRTVYASRAAGHFRDACRFADRTKQTNERIEARNLAAKALSFCNRYTEAQIYLQGAQKIAKNGLQEPTRSQVVESLERNILKIKDKARQRTETNNLPPPPEAATATSTSTAVISRQNVSVDGFAIIAAHQQLVGAFSGNRELVDMQINKESIKIRNQMGFYHQVGAWGYGIAGGTLGLGACASGGAAVTTAATAWMAGASGFALLGPMGLVAGGILSFYFGGKFAYDSYCQAKELHNESAIRVHLGQLLDDAVAKFSACRYHEFLQILGTSKTINGQIVRVIRYSPAQLDFIDVSDVVNVLSRHGVRPDGIAYILNAVGEAVLSGSLPLVAANNNAHILSRAQLIFDFIITNEKLTSCANKLDVAAKAILPTARVRFFLSNGEHGVDVDEDLVKDYNEMSMTDRLKEVVLVAQLNQAMIYIYENQESSANLLNARTLLAGIKTNAEAAIEKGSDQAPLILLRIDSVNDFMVAFGLEDASPVLSIKDHSYSTYPSGLERDLRQSVETKVHTEATLSALFERLLHSNPATRNELVSLEGKVVFLVYYAFRQIQRRLQEVKLAFSATKDAIPMNGSEDLALIRRFLPGGVESAVSTMLCEVIQSASEDSLSVTNLSDEQAMQLQYLLRIWLGDLVYLTGRLPSKAAQLRIFAAIAGSNQSWPVDHHNPSFHVIPSIDEMNCLKVLLVHILTVSDEDYFCEFARKLFQQGTDEGLLKQNVWLNCLFQLRDDASTASLYTSGLTKLAIKLPLLHAVVVTDAKRDLCRYVRDYQVPYLLRYRLKDPLASLTKVEEKEKWVYEAWKMCVLDTDSNEQKEVEKCRLEEVIPNAKELYKAHALHLVRTQRRVASERSPKQSFLNHLNDYYIGQKEAKGLIADTLFSTTSLKCVAFLCMGPSGVGKTELAKVVSSVKYGNRMIRLDMNNFTSQVSVTNLLGSPLGYVGSDKQGLLIEKYYEVMCAQEKIYCEATMKPAVILLDEFEKAHPEVRTFFLTMFDEGYFEAKDMYRLGGGPQRFTLDGCIIFVTSNLFQQEITTMAQRQLPSSEMRNQLERLNHIRQLLPNELLGRTVMLPFGPYSREEFRAILKLKLTRLNNTLRTNKRVVVEALVYETEVSVLDIIVQRCYGEGIQLRNLEKYLKFCVQIPLEEMIATASADVGAVKLVLQAQQDGLHAALQYFDSSLGEYYEVESTLLPQTM